MSGGAVAARIANELPPATGRTVDHNMRLTGLDALRGIAAVIVLGYHVWTEFGVFPIFARGYLAVDFFFAMSGYVMARTYEARLADGDLSTAKFIALRYRRLWAPLAAGTVLGLGFHFAAGIEVSATTILLGLCLVPDMAMAKPYVLNRPAWSIFFELLANALHGAVLSKVRTPIVLATAGVAALVLLAASIPYDAVIVGFRFADFWAGVPRVVAAYCLGVALWRRPLALRWPAAIAPLLLATGLLLVPVGLGWDLAFVLAFAPVLVALGARPFGGRLAIVLGGLSFPLYAVHFPMLQLARHFGLGPAAGIAGSLLAALLVAAAIDRRLFRHALLPSVRRSALAAN